MKKILKNIFFACMIIAICSVITVCAKDGYQIDRIAGDNRYETSAKISASLFESAETVVMASGENFADALTAGAYANYINSPLLLTAGNSLPEAIKTELERLGAENLIVVGGVNSIGDYIEHIGYNIDRIAGENRYTTSEAVRSRMDIEKGVIVSGGDFPDALSSIGLIHKENKYLKLSDGNFPLDYEFVIGGDKLLPGSPTRKEFRIAGDDRYETSTRIAERFGDFSTIILVSGANFPDALSAAPLSKAYDAPILLVNGNSIDKRTIRLLQNNDIERVIIVGGQSSVPESLKGTLNNILSFDPDSVVLKTPFMPGENDAVVKKAVKEYHDQKTDYKYSSRDYDPLGKYLSSLYIASYTNNSKIQMDKNGLPMVNYEGVYHYNPVTMSQYGLAAYAQFLDDRPEAEELFIRAADKIVSMMDADGSLRYTFSWYNYNAKKQHEVGWVSALAQGQSLSLLSRAYEHTKNYRYIEAGNRILSVLLTDMNKGGVMTTLHDISPQISNYVYFEEYPTNPNSYTLNGYMFTLHGLYDWGKLTERHPFEVGYNDSMYYFNCGVESLRLIIDLFDVGGFSNYDLGYMNFPMKPRLIASYHAHHISLLHSLHSITGIEKFKEVENRWISYVTPVE